MLRHSRSLALAALLCLAQSGCALWPGGKTYESAPEPDDAHVLVYVFRIDSEQYAAPATLRIGSEASIRLRDGEYTWRHIRPGSHSIATLWPPEANAPSLGFAVPFRLGTAYYVALLGRAAPAGGGVRVTTEVSELPSNWPLKSILDTRFAGGHDQGEIPAKRSR